MTAFSRRREQQLACVIPLLHVFPFSSTPDHPSFLTSIFPLYPYLDCPNHTFDKTDEEHGWNPEQILIDCTEQKTALVPPAGGGGDGRSPASSFISGTVSITESKVTGLVEQSHFTVGGSNGLGLTGCTSQDAGRGSMDPLRQQCPSSIQVVIAPTSERAASHQAHHRQNQHLTGDRTVDHFSFHDVAACRLSLLF